MKHVALFDWMSDEPPRVIGPLYYPFVLQTLLGAVEDTPVEVRSPYRLWKRIGYEIGTITVEGWILGLGFKVTPDIVISNTDEFDVTFHHFTLIEGPQFKPATEARILKRIGAPSHAKR